MTIYNHGTHDNKFIKDFCYFYGKTDAGEF